MSTHSHTNTKVLQELLDKIQEIKRINIGKISILAGYKRENYLSERLSTGDVSNKTIKAVRALYDRAKENHDILNSEGPVLIKDRVSTVIENQIEQIAVGRVILSILAEVQAPQMREPMIPQQLLGIYRRMVKDEVRQVREELQQRP